MQRCCGTSVPHGRQEASRFLHVWIANGRPISTGRPMRLKPRLLERAGLAFTERLPPGHGELRGTTGGREGTVQQLDGHCLQNDLARAFHDDVQRGRVREHFLRPMS